MYNSNEIAHKHNQLQIIDEYSELKKKKKINHSFRYETETDAMKLIRNPRTTQERKKIELRNGEDT